MAKEDRNTSVHVGFEEFDPRDPTVPEKNLLRAVLMSALTDVKKEGELGRKATEFFLNVDEDYIFSFRSICDFLSVDPKRVLTVAGLRNSDRENGAA
jgi:hypothetical protein